MNPVSVDMKDLILENPSSISEDLEFGDNLHIGTMPDQPDLCVALYDTGGPAPSPSPERYDRMTLQIRVRGGQNGFLKAHALAESIRELLRITHRGEINSAQYIGIWILSDIAHLGFDEKRRPELSFNLLIHRTEAETPN